VRRAYRREAEVIYPPVDVDRFLPLPPREEYYITVSRLVPYKRVSLLVEAFNRLERPLLVIGDGPERRDLERISGPSIRFLGWQSDADLAALLGKAKAFVFAAEEDFGIAPLEAQAAGCPVIAFGRGGLRETIVPGQTGLFFEEPTAESLGAAIAEFEAKSRVFDIGEIRRNAERFRRERFEDEFRKMVDEHWRRFGEDSRRWPGHGAGS
jgi:glycosyltransferase involved in cell wall biosynthesis